MRQFLLILFIAGFTITGISSAQEFTCPSLAPRLVVGQEGRVLYDNLVNVRSDPGLNGTWIGQLSSGAMFTVLAGSGCLNGYMWWQVEYHHATDSIIGWIAEGDSNYWLEPRGLRTQMTDANGQLRYYVSSPDGAVEPEGCLQPPDDYTRASVGSALLNVRTLFMLDHASYLYAALGGQGGSLRSRITQGSYTGGAEQASFGTHDGGGAVDLSVRDTIRGGTLADVEALVYALRVAGFAAWLRENDLFYPNSPVHIHAIALGDAELSEPARLQVDGQGGYMRGLDGLIPTYSGPRPDQYGGPVICRWVIEALGIADLPGS
jgi:hypothetical protein